MLIQIVEENSEPVIKITGSELKKRGFNVNDFVLARFSDNQIIISKNNETEKLKEMERKNPSIKKLMDEFGLDLVFG